MKERLKYVTKDKKDPRDKIMTHAKIDEEASKAIPPMYSLIEDYSGIENQYSVGSCVANATVTALEIMGRRSDINFELSRLYVYYFARALATDKVVDKGTTLRSGFKSINYKGVCDEEYWVYDRKMKNVKPSKEAQLLGKDNLVVEYERLLVKSDYGLKMIKFSLLQGTPVTFAINIGKKFYRLRGELESQNYTAVNDTDNKSVGNHAMTIVGYDDELGGFIIQNSWGKRWGYNGTFLLKYDVFKQNTFDAWRCTNFVYEDIEIRPIEIGNYSEYDIGMCSNIFCTAWRYVVKLVYTAVRSIKNLFGIE